MIIDTHIHLDGEEFAADLDEVVARAKQAGVGKMLLPAIDANTTDAVETLSNRLKGYAYPMIGLHPEEVRNDWREATSWSAFCGYRRGGTRLLLEPRIRTRADGGV